MPMPRKYTDEEFVKAFNESVSIREILTKLNVSPAGGNYLAANKLIERLQLDKSRLKGQAWNKDRVYAPSRTTESYLTKDSKAITSHRLRIRLIDDGFKLAQCEKCGNVEWQGQPIALELDHIDGDHYNNEIENLQILCPNCHAQTDNYRSKNRKDKLT